MPQANAQTAEPIQTLDRVHVFNARNVVEMGYNDANRMNKLLGATSTSTRGLIACQMSPSKGLFCLDNNKVVLNWTSTTSTTPTVVFSCEDTALGLDARKAETCTSVTTDIKNDIWIAGKKNNAHSVIKIVRKTKGANPDPMTWSCPEGVPLRGALSNAGQYQYYCAQEYASGRPLLQDMSAVDDLFPLGAGILGLENRSALVFYPASAPYATPVEIASSKNDWKLNPGESLQGATVIPVKVGGNVDYFGLATTSSGRVLGKQVPNSSTTTKAFDTLYNIASRRSQYYNGTSLSPSAQCSSDPAVFEIRSSIKSQGVFVTDRNFCEVSPLTVTANYTTTPGSVTGSPITLTKDDRTTFRTSVTTSTATTTYPPTGISVSPGIDVNLANCGMQPCAFIPDNGDGNAYAGAQLSGVTYTGPGNMVVFQIRNIPDCRLFGGTGEPPVPAICNQPDVIITGPRGEYLNVQKLLPAEVLQQFNGFGTGPGLLPQMLISPMYTAPVETRVFDAFFGITDPAIRFRGIFTAQFDITQLLYPNAATPVPSACGVEGASGDSPNQPNLVWDLITTVSERYTSVGGPANDVTGADREFVDMLTNTGCFNPTAGAGGRWSLYTYGLRPTPGSTAYENQFTYARLMDKLYRDMTDTRQRLACQAATPSSYDDLPIDEATVPPLTAATCTSLYNEEVDGYNRLQRCYDATVDPVSSGGAENCGAFRQELLQYQAILDSAMLNTASADPDPANRLGELRARVRVVLHVLNDHFMPSVPSSGFLPPSAFPAP